MKATPEQQEIIKYITNNDGLTMTSAVAGSGKTTLLVAIAKTLAKNNHAQSGLYLAYNKAVATSSAKKFPKYVKCSTTHSLAYKPTVIDNKLKLGQFSYRNITERIRYETKCGIVDSIKEFCLSLHLSFEEYAKENDIPDNIVPIANKYLGLMEQGKIECTHDFYLKMFHMLLHGNHITYDEFDFIALDEAGDLNAVTLAIFNLLPAKKKIMVGDPHQNIYMFNHTINCFEVMEGKGKILPMSQSFRTAAPIAKRIEKFCTRYMDKNMKFKGIELEDDTITTRAFIARTNSSLISKMLELNAAEIQYGLTRTAKQIFQVPLMLCGLKHRGFITIPEYKHLQDDVNAYYEQRSIQEDYKSPLAYIKVMHDDDVQLKNALSVILKHGKKAIIECYAEASKHEKSNQNYTLGTSHSTKGLEFDSVELADDLNTAISPIVLKSISAGRDTLVPSEIGELNLYYVACSRAKKSLINATHL